MANIRKRNGRYQVQIRRRGFPSQVKTFSRHSDARRWAIETELKLERDPLTHCPAPSHHTIGALHRPEFKGESSPGPWSAVLSL